METRRIEQSKQRRREEELIEMISGATGKGDVNRETRIDDLGIDSIGFLDLILAMEDRLGIRLRSEGLDEQALASCGSFVDYVLRQQP